MNVMMHLIEHWLFFALKNAFYANGINSQTMKTMEVPYQLCSRSNLETYLLKLLSVNVSWYDLNSYPMIYMIIFLY